MAKLKTEPVDRSHIVPERSMDGNDVRSNGSISEGLRTFWTSNRVCSTPRSHQMVQWKFRRRQATSGVSCYEGSNSCKFDWTLGQLRETECSFRTAGSLARKCNVGPWHLWICCLLILLPVIPADIYNEPRLAGMSFRASTVLRHGHVTCGRNRNLEQAFPSPTWICQDMRINGTRLWYLLLPGDGVDRSCGQGDDQLINGRNDVAALCREMMKAHGDYSQLWAAMIVEATCEEGPGDRVIFARQGADYAWERFASRLGSVITLQCMTLIP